MERLSNPNLLSSELPTQNLRTLIRDPFNQDLVLVGNSEHADLAWDDRKTKVIKATELNDEVDKSKEDPIPLYVTMTSWEETDDMTHLIESDPEHHTYAGTDPTRNPFYAATVDEDIISRDLSQFYPKPKADSGASQSHAEVTEYNDPLKLLSWEVGKDGKTHAHYELEATLAKIPDVEQIESAHNKSNTVETFHAEISKSPIPASDQSKFSYSSQTNVDLDLAPTQQINQASTPPEKTKSDFSRSTLNTSSDESSVQAQNKPSNLYSETKIPSPADLAREIQAGINGANRIVTSAAGGFVGGAGLYPRAVLPGLVTIAQTSFKPIPVALEGIKNGADNLIYLGDQYKQILPVLGNGLGKLADAGVGTFKNLGGGAAAVGEGLNNGAKISGQFWFPILKFSFTPILNLSGLLILLGSFPYLAVFKGFDTIWKIGETINDNVSKKWALEDLKKGLLLEFDKFKQPLQLWQTRFNQENLNISKKIAHLKEVLPQNALAWRELDDLEISRRKIFEQAQPLVTHLSDLINQFESDLKQAATPNQVQDIISGYRPKLASPELQDNFARLETQWQGNQNSYKNLNRYLDMIAEKYKPATKLSENIKDKNQRTARKINQIENNILKDLQEIAKVFYRKDAVDAVGGLSKQIQSNAKNLDEVFQGIINSLPENEQPQLLKKLEEFVNLFNFLKSDPLILTNAELHTIISLLNGHKLSEMFQFLLQLLDAQAGHKLLNFQNILPSLYSLDGRRMSDNDGLGPLQKQLGDSDRIFESARKPSYNISGQEKASLNLANSRIKKENQDIARANEIIANSNIEKLGLNQTQYALINWDSSAMKPVVEEMLNKAHTFLNSGNSLDTEDFSLINNLYQKIVNSGNTGKFITGKQAINLFAASYKTFLNSVNFKNDGVINIVDLSQDILTKFQTFLDYKNQTKNLGRDLQQLYYALHGKTHPILEPINSLQQLTLRSIGHGQTLGNSQDTLATPTPPRDETHEVPNDSHTTPDPVVGGGNTTPPPPKSPPNGPGGNENDDDDSESLNLGDYILMYGKLKIWFRGVINKFSPNYKRFEELLKMIEKEIERDKSDLEKISEWIQECYEIQQKINDGDEPKALPLISTPNFHWTTLLNGLDAISIADLRYEVIEALINIIENPHLTNLVDTIELSQPNSNLLDSLYSLEDSVLQDLLENIATEISQMQSSLSTTERQLLDTFANSCRDYSNQLSTQRSKQDVSLAVQAISEITDISSKDLAKLKEITQAIINSSGLNSASDLLAIAVTDLADRLDLIQETIDTRHLQDHPLCQSFTAAVQSYQGNLANQLASNQRANANLEKHFETANFHTQISRFIKDEMNISQQMELLSGRSVEYIEQSLHDLFADALNPETNIINLTPSGINSDYGLFYNLHKQNRSTHGKFMTKVLMPAEEEYLKKFIFEKFIPEFAHSLVGPEKTESFTKQFSQIFDPKSLETYHRLSSQTFTNPLILQPNSELVDKCEKTLFQIITANIPSTLRANHSTTIREIKRLIEIQTAAKKQIKFFTSTPGSESQETLNGLERTISDASRIYQTLFEELFEVAKATVLSQYKTTLPNIKYDRLPVLNKLLGQNMDNENKLMVEAAFLTAKQKVSAKIEKVLNESGGESFDQKIKNSLFEMINRTNLEE